MTRPAENRVQRVKTVQGDHHSVFAHNSKTKLRTGKSIVASFDRKEIPRVMGEVPVPNFIIPHGNPI